MEKYIKSLKFLYIVQFIFIIITIVSLLIMRAEHSINTLIADTYIGICLFSFAFIFGSFGELTDNLKKKNFTYINVILSFFTASPIISGIIIGVLIMNRKEEKKLKILK